jgi:hypothetical protein
MVDTLLLVFRFGHCMHGKEPGCIPRANSTVTVLPHDVIDSESVLLTQLPGGPLNRLQFFHSACNFDFCIIQFYQSM